SAANPSRKPEPVRQEEAEAANDADAPRAGEGEDAPRADAASSEADLTARIDQAQSINAVTDLMLAPETQAALAAMPPGLRDEVREHAKARLVALGWPARSNAKSRKAAVA
ncbi:hypothetical protein CS379_11885, partial [Methylobacterium frigidaeris]